jgi:predicted GH43/DUF377 family glycosyl hydrolase
MFKRHPLNPLISPKDAVPSQPDFEVIGTFNAGVTTYGDETLMLVRVAERPKSEAAQPGIVRMPYLADDGSIQIRELRQDDPDYDTADSRFVIHKPTSELYLTSMSHLRLARSSDGVHFTLDQTPWMKPTLSEESFGVEDGRIVHLDGRFYVNYTAVSPRGISTGLVSTEDFTSFERHGIIFPPANRDVTLLPQKVNGKYFCYHRPMPGMFGGYNIWVAESPDLQHWGKHRVVMTSQSGGWEAGRVGGGAPPVWTEAGWLSIYHAADPQDRYCLGAFLTALDEPGRLIARTQEPILSPEAPYETDGFFGNVVFTCGVVLAGEMLKVYYGASDETMALAEAPVSEVLAALGV